MRRLQSLAAAIGLAAAFLGSVACDSGESINGAGATFPYVLYSKWFDEYNKLRPEVRINYQSQGSGAGIRQLINGTVFFGASDGPMSDQQLESAPGPILHLPTVLGADVPVYNIPGVSSELRFSGQLLADIFLGSVTTWNDPAIATLNPDVALPPMAITVVHRSEGSGTTFIWTDFLAKVSPEWRTRVGVGTAVNWPVGVGGKGNEGVSGLVTQTPGAIGYVELVYALQTKMNYGSVQNAAGEFIRASRESVTAAAAATADRMPADFRVSITNPPGSGVYPIASFTWMLLYESHENTAQSRAMVDFMKWALTEGQSFTGPLGYARLPDAVIERELAVLARIKTS